MAFVRGNQAIRDHSVNGKDLHLFRSLGKGQSYRYLGRFACSSWEYRKGVHVNGDERRTIVFHLVQPEGDEEAAAAPEPGSATLGQLQQRALNAAAKPGEKARTSPNRSPFESPRLSAYDAPSEKPPTATAEGSIG